MSKKRSSRSWLAPFLSKRRSRQASAALTPRGLKGVEQLECRTMLAGDVIYVGDSPYAHFSSIQDGVDAAKSGDTVIT